MFGKGLGLGPQGAQNFASRGIAVSVQNAVAAVRTLAGKGKFGSVAIEFGAPLDQLFDALRAFLNQNFGGIGIAQAVAGVERVLKVQANFVLVAEGGGDTALGILRSGIGDFALGKNQHATGWRQFDRGP